MSSMSYQVVDEPPGTETQPSRVQTQFDFLFWQASREKNSIKPNGGEN